MWAVQRARSVASGLLLGGLTVIGGCGGDRPASPTAVDLFVPRTMRLHPIFTQVADVDGAGKPDGIVAQVEFQDQFGDPTKAAATVLFELYERRREPPYTGRRLIPPFVASLATAADQRARWNGTLRTYRFALAYPAINPALDYTLTATVELTGGGRFPVDKLVLTGHKDAATGPKGSAGDGKGLLGL